MRRTRHRWNAGAGCAVAIAALALGAARQAAAGDVFETARGLKEGAIELLKLAQTADDTKATLLKEAIGRLQKALGLLEKVEGPRKAEAETEIQELNSLIYWARKVMPVVDLSGKRPPPPPPPPPRAPGKSNEDLAKEYFERAQQYAKEQPGDPFRIAVRYLEVADRFQGTKWSLEAQRLSLEYQMKALARRDTPAPAPAPESAARPVPPEPRLPEPTKIDRDAEVAKLEGLFQGETLGEAVAAVDAFIRRFPADPLKAELVSLRGIAAARDEAVRVRAARLYFAEHPEGRFAAAVVGLKHAVEHADAWEILATAVTSNAPDRDKETACRGFLETYGGSPRRAEVEILLAALGAEDEGDKAIAWARYRTDVPDGRFGTMAVAFLMRAETTLVAAIARLVGASDLERAVTLAGAYTQMLPRAAATAELRSLARALGAARGAERANAIETHLALHARGPIAEALRSMQESHRASAAESAYEALARALEGAQPGDAAAKRLQDFLRAHGTNDYSSEVRDLVSALTLGTPRARLAAARKFVSERADSALAGMARSAVSAASFDMERDAFEGVRLACEGRGSSHAARLSACESYLGEFPDGAHAGDVRKWEGQTRQLIAAERDAFAEIEKALTGGVALEEGVSRCDEFLRDYPGGANFAAVEARRRGFQERLTELEAERVFGDLRKQLRDGRLSPVAKADLCTEYLSRYGRIAHRQDALESARALARIPVSPRTGAPVRASFTSRGTYLAVAGSPNGAGPVVELMRMPELEVAARFRISPSVAIEAMTFSADDARLLLGDAAGGLSVVDFGDAKVTGRYRLSLGGVLGIAPTSDGYVAVASRSDSRARLWRNADWSLASDISCRGGVSAVAADRDGRLYAVGGADGSIAVHRRGNAEPVWRDAGAHEGAVTRLAFSPRGDCLASASGADGLLRLRNALSGAAMWEAACEGSFAFCSDQLLATPRAVHNVSRGDKAAELGGDPPVAASPDGRFVFVGDEERDAGTVWYLPALLAK